MNEGWVSGSCQRYAVEPIGSAERALVRAHAAERPSWACMCGEPWPCRVARVTLEEEFYADELRTIMSCFMFEAAIDMPCAPSSDLSARFMAWVRAGADPGRDVGYAPVRRPE